MDQTRRKFIKNTVVGLAAGAGAAALAAGAPEAGASAQQWDKTADVVVVGSGMGGCAAALAVHEAGAGALILEKASRLFWGGNTSVSGGNFYAPSSEKYYEDLMKMSAGRSDKTAARTLADNAAAAVEWLEKIGVRLERGRRDGYATAIQKGSGLVKDLSKILQSRGIEVLFEAKAKELLQNDRQQVAGVRVAVKSGFMNVQANRAVILATGGYLGNEEMIVKYVGAQATAVVNQGFRHITGDGHRMALELGADLINMGDCRLAPMQPGSKASVAAFYPPAIIVNKESRRFIDEASAHGSGFGRMLFGQTDGVAYLILDERGLNAVSPSARERFAKAGGKWTAADSVEELAAANGLNPIALRQTIDAFNAAVKDGMTLALQPAKTGNAARLAEPKFYATAVVNGSTLTFGGIRINKNCQVLNLEGGVIARLYAAGILVGGVYYQNYKSGCGLASAAAFGRLAGISAAAEKPPV